MIGSWRGRRCGLSCQRMSWVGSCESILEFLDIVDDLNTVLILLFGGLLPHRREVAIDRHY